MNLASQQCLRSSWIAPHVTISLIIFQPADVTANDGRDTTSEDEGDIVIASGGDGSRFDHIIGFIEDIVIGTPHHTLISFKKDFVVDGLAWFDFVFLILLLDFIEHTKCPLVPLPSFLNIIKV